MAVCEKCKNPTSYPPNEMFVALEEKIFIGPCCAPTTHSIPVHRPDYGQVHVLPGRQDEVEYGIEISNKVGVKAYAHYYGLSLSYERSPEEIRRWLKGQGFIEQSA